MSEIPRTGADEAFERRILDLSPLADKGSSEEQINVIEGVAIDMLLEMKPQDIAAIAEQYPQLARLPEVLNLLRTIGEQAYRSNEGDQ